MRAISSPKNERAVRLHGAASAAYGAIIADIAKFGRNGFIAVSSVLAHRNARSQILSVIRVDLPPDFR